VVNLTELKAGMRIKIVAEPPKGSAFEICKDPHQTEMGQYLNKVVTITRVHERCVSIKEDRGRYAWTPMLIEKVVSA
jgi:hypothetical protein